MTRQHLSRPLVAAALAAELTSAAEALGDDAAETSGRTGQRLAALVETLTGLAERLR